LRRERAQRPALDHAGHQEGQTFGGAGTEGGWGRRYRDRGKHNAYKVG
jgi:hypothetical protein